MSKEKEKTKKYIIESLLALLIGGIFGYFIIAHLIPGAIDFYKEIKYNNAIVSVYDQINQCVSYHKKDKKEFVEALKIIDISDCPSEFKYAFFDYVAAADEFFSYQETNAFFKPLSNTKEKELETKYIKSLEELDSIAHKYAKFKDEENSDEEHSGVNKDNSKETD